MIQAGSQNGISFGEVKLWRDPRATVFYLLVSLAVETADPTPEFFRGGAVGHKGAAFQRVRSRLQSKGTRVPNAAYGC